MEGTTFHDDSERGLLPDVNEDSPLLIRHMSMEKNPSSGRTPRHRRDGGNERTRFQRVVHGTRTAVATAAALPIISCGGGGGGGGGVRLHHRHRGILLLTWLTSLVLLGLLCAALVSMGDTSTGTDSTAPDHHGKIIPIEDAREHYLEVDPGIFLWYRTWGNRMAKPVVFVHGGPGNAIQDYGLENAEFFSAHEYFVVEVDQRGTGKSQPSVRESAINMKFYTNVSIDQLAADYERVRHRLNIDRWLVFGGSFGSTVGINYATRYPRACLGLIVRGIYLDTPAEMQAVYARSSHVHNPQRLHEFDILYHYVQQQQQRQTTREPGDAYIDPNDAQALTAAYAKLIEAGDRQAIWHWHVYENNLMETDPANLLDPDQIDEAVFPEAQSVAFFETRLWLRGAYENPAQLLNRINQLAVIPHISICQGRHDEVCPAKYTRLLTSALDDANAYFTVSYLNSGHEQSDPVMAACLKERLTVFGQEYDQRKQQEEEEQQQQQNEGEQTSANKTALPKQ